MTVDGQIIGECLVGTQVSIIDYSRKERDQFGNITIIERGYTDFVSYNVSIETKRADEIRSILAGVRAQSAIYVGHDLHDVTKVTGYLNSFAITLDNSITSSLSLEVESELHGAP